VHDRDDSPAGAGVVGLWNALAGHLNSASIRRISLAFVARTAVRFDEACGFAALLAWIRIFDELK